MGFARPLNLRAALPERSLDLAILMGPVSEFSVENVALPPFDLHWYRATTNPETDLSKIPVISYSTKTRPYRELMAELSRRVPTGWSIIGRSPTQILTNDPNRPFLCDIGDQVQFERINLQTFDRISKEQAHV